MEQRGVLFQAVKAGQPIGAEVEKECNLLQRTLLNKGAFFMTTATEPKRITLTPAEHDYVKDLLSKGGHEKHLPVEKDVDGNLFGPLTKKGIVERINAVRGRGGSRGEVRVLIDEEAFGRIETSNPRQPRGSKTPSGPRKAREATPADDYLQSGAIIIHASEIQNIKDSLADYIKETTPTAIREYELRRSKTTSPAEIGRLAALWDKEQLSDAEVGHRLTALLSAKDTPFHAYLVGKYGKKMVALLGYKDDVPDSPDAKPTVADSIDVEVTPARSNGKTTPPKAPARKR